MENPKVKLKIDAEADIWNYIYFTKYGGGKDIKVAKMFLPKELYYILNKKYSQNQRNKIIKEYIENVFNKKGEEIKNGVIKAKKIGEKSKKNISIW